MGDNAQQLQLTELVTFARQSKELHSHETAYRCKLAASLQTIADLIDTQSKSDNADKAELLDALIGAYVYTAENINQEYHLHAPDFKKGYLYNSGSPLYTDLINALATHCGIHLTARERLIYINKFHHYVESNKTALNEQLKDIKVTGDETLAATKHMLTHQLTILTNPVKKIVNGIPKENVITTHMKQLPDEYLNKKKYIAEHESRLRPWFLRTTPNPKRVFLNQLCWAISTIECEDETNLQPDEFTYSQRVKMGAILYFKQSILNEYWISSRASRSIAYQECKKILNVTNEDNLDEPQKLACISAFKAYIDDLTARRAAETAGRIQFGDQNLLSNIDAKLDAISISITHMQADLQYAFTKAWPATIACASVGMILGSLPGYSVGSVIGLAVADTLPLSPAQNTIGQGVSRLATAYFGCRSTRDYFSLLSTDFVISSTLSRGFAKLFEIVGFAAGGVAGGAVGFTFDLTYKGLHELCTRYLDFYDHHPEQMRSADPELIKCLLTLPEELFSPDKQNQIKYAAGIEQEQARPQLN